MKRRAFLSVAPGLALAAPFSVPVRASEQPVSLGYWYEDVARAVAETLFAFADHVVEIGFPRIRPVITELARELQESSVAVLLQQRERAMAALNRFDDLAQASIEELMAAAEGAEIIEVSQMIQEVPDVFRAAVDRALETIDSVAFPVDEQFRRDVIECLAQFHACVAEAERDASLTFAVIACLPVLGAAVVSGIGVGWFAACVLLGRALQGVRPCVRPLINCAAIAVEDARARQGTSMFR